MLVSFSQPPTQKRSKDLSCPLFEGEVFSKKNSVMMQAPTRNPPAQGAQYTSILTTTQDRENARRNIDQRWTISLDLPHHPFVMKLAKDTQSSGIVATLSRNATMRGQSITSVAVRGLLRWISVVRNVHQVPFCFCCSSCVFQPCILVLSLDAKS
jgi:hypothetical protein